MRFETYGQPCNGPIMSRLSISLADAQASNRPQFNLNPCLSGIVFALPLIIPLCGGSAKEFLEWVTSGKVQNDRCK